jgi:hypothetical protein
VLNASAVILGVLASLKPFLGIFARLSSGAAIRQCDGERQRRRAEVGLSVFGR